MSSYLEEQRRKLTEATRKEEKENFAMKLLKLGKNTLDEIAECTGLTLRRVKALAKTVTA